MRIFEVSVGSALDLGTRLRSRSEGIVRGGWIKLGPGTANVMGYGVVG